MGFLFFKDQKICFRVGDLLLSTKNVVHEYFRISFPVLVSDSFLGIGNSAIAVVMGHIGSDFVVANAIVSTVMHLSVIVIQGVSQAGSTITGITLGEGNIGLYQVTDAIKALAEELMRAVAITILFQCTNNILTKGVLRGGGDTRFLMFADIFFLWACSIPLGILSGLVLHWTGFWIYIMLRIDQFIKVILCIFRLKSGKWIKKISFGLRVEPVFLAFFDCSGFL